VNDDTAHDNGQSPVEVLAEEFLERRANGENVTVEDYAAQYPELADDIREVLPAFEAMKSLAADWKRAVADNYKVGPKLPFQLGEFLLEREIGRGGMGVVYEAQHTNLRRRVAVKLLRSSSLLNEKDVARFHREARAAAALHHTNIVPVFDFGEAEGFHYIAMQLIKGEGLDAYVAKLQTQKDQPEAHYGSPAFWRQVASIGVQAANALHYAHTHGTIHHDIKPGNLLLDGEGVLWVADFGLARQNAVDSTTQSGVLAGTLRYLAPEHFNGQCDERTDQYGLGLSLYELVTLQPATGDSVSHAKIMQRITEAKIIPPRQIVSSVPKDLETIIQKATAAEPSRRFRNCHELAEDLQRFLDGRPIAARPVTVPERFWRWSKRNPALAVSTAMSVALLVAVAVVSVAGYRAERLQRQRAESVSEYAEQALDTVFDRYAQTSQSSEFHSDVSQTTTVLTQDAAEMLERLLPIFDRLAALEGQSSEVRLRSIAARKRVGDIHQRLGQFESAIGAYKQALSGFRQLAVSNTTKYLMPIAALYNEIGSSQLMLGRTEDAASSHESALLQLQEIPGQDSDEVRYQLARTHYLLARRLTPGQSPSAVDDFAPDRGDQRPGPVGDGPPRGSRPPRDGERPPRHGPPPGHRPPPRRDAPPGEGTGPSASEEHLRAAIELLESDSETRSLAPAEFHLLATCLRSLSSDRFSGKGPEEQAADTRALEILAALVADYPDAPEYLHSQVDALAAINTRDTGSIYPEDLEAAEQRLRRAVGAGQDLVDSHPYVPQYSLTLIHAKNKLAHVLERRSAESQGPKRQLLQAAREQYESAARLQSILVKRFPKAAAYRSWLQQFERSADRLTKEMADVK